MLSNTFEVRRALPASLALVGLLAVPAQAQQPPDGSYVQPPPPAPPPMYQPAPPAPPYQPAPPIAQPYPPPPVAQPYQPAPPLPVTQPYQPAPPLPVTQPYPPAPPLPVAQPYPPAPPPPPVVAPVIPGAGAPLPPPPPLVVNRYRNGRVLYGVGIAVGLVGSGLTLSSIVVTSVYGLGEGNGQIGPGLAYAGSGASGAAVILTATGLGLQHSALAAINADPGRAMYGLGTLFGVLGLVGVGTSYYFGLAQPTQNSTAVAFGTSIAATALLGVGGILYFIDANRMLRAYNRFARF